MNDEDLQTVTVESTRPNGSVTYELSDVKALRSELVQRQDEGDDYHLGERGVAKAVARNWFEEDYPLLSAHSSEIVVEELDHVGGADWKVSIVFTASAKRGLRSWIEDGDGQPTIYCNGEPCIVRGIEREWIPPEDRTQKDIEYQILSHIDFRDEQKSTTTEVPFNQLKVDGGAEVLIDYLNERDLLPDWYVEGHLEPPSDE